MRLPRTVSDYAPIIFNWKEEVQGGPRTFRYEITWQSHPDYRTRVEEWWRINIEGTAMFKLSTKLDNVRRNI